MSVLDLIIGFAKNKRHAADIFIFLTSDIEIVKVEGGGWMLGKKKMKKKEVIEEENVNQENFNEDEEEESW